MFGGGELLALLVLLGGQGQGAAALGRCTANVWVTCRCLTLPHLPCPAPVQSVIQTNPLHAIVLLLGVPLLLAALNTMWFVKIVKGAYKLVFKQQQQQHAHTADAATAVTAAAALSAGGGAAGRCYEGKQRVTSDKVVAIRAYAGSGGGFKPEHFE